MSQPTRLKISTAYGNSLGNKIDRLSQSTNSFEDNWIEVEKVKRGHYKVTADSMTNKMQPELGFSDWDSDVGHLDPDSDDWTCCEIASHLKWDDVDLTPEIILAPSLTKLKQALSRVRFTAWDPGDL